MRNVYAAFVAFCVSAFASAPAMAQQAAIDVSTASGYLETNGNAAINAIGLVLLGLAAAAMVYKWAKATFFG